jgi:dynein heavy chain, axonemal
LKDGYKYSESGIYISPSAGTIDDYLEYISGLPLNPSPEAFGMHDNADITNAQS